ncbi:MAG: hypothetical protein R3C12_00290 [Planctomycetaceae bacterium]
MRNWKALGEENPTQLRLAGDLALLRGNALEAEELWLRSASMTPLRETHERLAKLYESRGNTNARDGQRARMSLLQGKQHFWENKLADATTSLEQAVELDPSLTDGWFYLGKSGGRGKMPTRPATHIASAWNSAPAMGGRWLDWPC